MLFLSLIMFIFLSIESNRFFTSTAHVTSKLFSGGSIYKPDKFLNYKQSDIIIIEDDLFGKRRNITENIYNDESLQLGKPKVNNFRNKNQILFNTFEKQLDCDFFTENICLEVQYYPREIIHHLLNKSSGFTTEHIPEKYKAARTNFKREMDSTIRNYTFSKKYFNTRRDNFRHNDSIQSHGIFICPSEMEYARPKRGRSVSGEWKDIVNVEEYTQTLRMEKCLEPLSSCNYVSHHFKSECSQVYNYHRLLSWNKERGLHMDIFKVPTCCSCNMKGYSYLYPPLIRNFNKSQRQIHNKKKNSGKSKEVAKHKRDVEFNQKYNHPSSSCGSCYIQLCTGYIYLYRGNLTNY
ncbi:uncharacterized protein [Lepeophtheirus salmonis]|uniref:uncharacterized protein isoform X2 n=1 Tax=Lepeophtheirus salmonis TaxID=72036 RepID=UPI003AF3478F